MKRTLLMAAAAATLLAAGTAGAQTQPQSPAADPPAVQNRALEGAAAGQPHWTTASLEDLIGRDVYAPNGDKLGEVADVILDSSTREATVAIIDHGGFLGLGTKQAPIDVALMRTEGDRIIIDGMTKEQLQAMQDFDYDDTTVSLGRESKSGAPATNSATPAAPATPAPQ
ncbi:sporulation protein YlmC with PRC-barrel domain [Azospirillum fermentarium]|uniref:PRC-barrel domain-containing protein n=1 Tax=Azospirillum fermentarium TaxID=1233114 RepID=UPI0022280A18|nr:PRC-barrel domain-containing protein [Azospirillum fermentarium]MCW2244617.1 sporulation protein YlmC with PRC-barrel domain [Azospirillum fermentarium]